MQIENLYLQQRNLKLFKHYVIRAKEAFERYKEYGGIDSDFTSVCFLFDEMLMASEDIKQKFANLIMAFSFHHHMTIKAGYDVMVWIGFKYEKGWHYNSVNYGS